MPRNVYMYTRTTTYALTGVWLHACKHLSSSIISSQHYTYNILSLAWDRVLTGMVAIFPTWLLPPATVPFLPGYWYAVRVTCSSRIVCSYCTFIRSCSYTHIYIKNDYKHNRHIDMPYIVNNQKIYIHVCLDTINPKYHRILQIKHRNFTCPYIHIYAHQCTCLKLRSFRSLASCSEIISIFIDSIFWFLNFSVVDKFSDSVVAFEIAPSAVVYSKFATLSGNLFLMLSRAAINAASSSLHHDKYNR